MLRALRVAISVSAASPAAGLAFHARRRHLTSGAAAAAAAAAAAVAPAYADAEWARAPKGGFDDAYFDGFDTSPTGLVYKTVQPGSGAKPNAGQKIRAHYAGFLLSGKKFDASYDRGSPLAFEVGVGRVIKGWDEALLDMSVGEKRILKIPSSLGYGSRGAGGVIPPDATLVFFVELVSA